MHKEIKICISQVNAKVMINVPFSETDDYDSVATLLLTRNEKHLQLSCRFLFINSIASIQWRYHVPCANARRHPSNVGDSNLFFAP